MAKKKNIKNKSGIITLIVGIICFALTLIIYNYLSIDDVFCVILMTFSGVIFVYGLFQIIRDTYN